MQDSTFQDVFRKRLGDKKLNRILLVVPPDADSDSFSFDMARMKRYWNYPPYGLGLIAARARAEGLEARILNLNNIVLESSRAAVSADSFSYDTVVSKAIEDEVANFHPDFVGLTCMFSLAHQSAKQVCSKIRVLVPDVVIGIGGVHISNSFTEDIMRQTVIDDFSDVDVFFYLKRTLHFVIFVVW